MKTENSEKQVCIFTDLEHTTEQKRVFDEVLNNVRTASKNFELLTGRKLEHEDFICFIFNPKDFTAKTILEQKEVPEGMNREQYLKLYQLPDLSSVELPTVNTRNKTNYYSISFIMYNGIEFELTNTAIELINHKNIYVTQEQFGIYQKLQKVAKLFNELINYEPSLINEINLHHSSIFIDGKMINASEKIVLSPRKFKQWTNNKGIWY